DETLTPARARRFVRPPPAEPELGEAVQQHDQRPLAGLDVMQSLVADLGISLTKLAAQEPCRLLFRHPTRAAGAVLTRTHCGLPGGCVRAGLGFPGWLAPSAGPGCGQDQPGDLVGVAGRRGVAGAN